MKKQLIIGLVGEGKTDYRFLNSIVKRTFEKIAFECKGDIEILDVQDILTPTQAFKEFVHKSAKDATENYGVMILCVHTDADDRSDQNTFQNKIQPAFNAVSELENELCKLIPIVPIVMVESWMLADPELFCEEIGTSLSFSDLEIQQSPENISNPKDVIKNAIRIAFEGRSKRRFNLKISELYSPLGQKIKLTRLEKLSSYLRFQDAIREVLQQMNYL